jgi:hypothetical protein
MPPKSALPQGKKEAAPDDGMIGCKIRLPSPSEMKSSLRRFFRTFGAERFQHFPLDSLLGDRT